MKTIIALLLALSIPALVGCQQAYEPTAEQSQQVEDRISAVEEKIPSADTPNTTPETPAEISKEAAEQIALEHAELTADAVKRLHTEYDRDRVNHYDVEFHHERYEYSYEIHAVTGEILDFEKEIDD